MRLILNIILAIIVSGPALATTSAEDLRSLVIGGDVKAVEAAIDGAVAQDFATHADPALQRDLFAIFHVTHPDIGAFTEKWLREQPTSAYAMTARAWYFHKIGSVNRGDYGTRITFSGGLEIMSDQYSKAETLFVAATKARPDLLAASDGIIAVSLTVGGRAAIPTELERIMAIYPTRGSLMRAMRPLSPQWGGSPEDVSLVCARYAPMVVAIKDYTPNVCWVDAVFYANFQDEQAREAAYQALQMLDNPILDDARLAAAMDRRGPATQRLAVLEKFKAKRHLTTKEASALDTATIEANQLDPTVYYAPNYEQALSDGVADLRLKADRDPFNTTVVLNYLGNLPPNWQENGGDFGLEDARTRVQRLLTAVPHSWSAWQTLADLTYDNTADTIKKASGYLQNSIFYSNYGQEALQNALSVLAARTDRYSKRKATSGALNLTPEDLTELDLLGKCPIVALSRIAQSVCAQRGIGGDQCLDVTYGFLLRPMLQDVQDRGACETETNAPLESLLRGPEPADF